MDKIWDLLGFAVIVSLVIVALNIAYQLSTASGKIDFCYVSENAYERINSYKLMGHRSWRPDLFQASAATYEEAVEKAKVTNCPIKVTH